MKLLCILLSIFYVSISSAASFEGKVEDWKKEKGEKFSDPEANFKTVLKKLLESYVDKNVTEEELYRAATAGMLASLNSGKEGESWNTLLSPRMLDNFIIEKTGKLTGIGIVLSFDDKTGYARILGVIPNSAASKADLKKDDQILSVNGQRYKDKGLSDMALAIRGPVGDKVHLKVLREDRILNLTITRDVVSLTEVDAKKVDPQTGILTIGFYKEGTARKVEEKLGELNSKSLKKLIIDLRGNSGGTFDDAIKVAELFLPKGTVVVKTKSRGGKIEEYKSNREPWRSDVQLVILTDSNTASSAELLTAALKEGRQAMTIGNTTKGKWNVQSIEHLPNKFAIKYSVSKFESASGQSYEGTGMKPDLEIEGPKGPLLGELQKESDLAKRTKQDAPLKAAIEVSTNRL